MEWRRFVTYLWNDPRILFIFIFANLSSPVSTLPIDWTVMLTPGHYHRYFNNCDDIIGALSRTCDRQRYDAQWPRVRIDADLWLIAELAE